jgi:cytoskeletal protein CcmA (bactofilin family)
MRQRRLIRAAKAVLAVALATSTLVAFPGVASADETTQPGSIVTAVSADVGPTTPLWTLDVKFSLSGVTCPAELHYKIATTAESTSICGAGETAPSSVTVQRQVFVGNSSGVQALRPDHMEDVRAGVYAGGTSLVNNPPSIGAGAQIHVPPAPVWIGVGDGYTSAVRQVNDGDTSPDYTDNTDPDNPLFYPAYNPNAADLSWIAQAAEKLEGDYTVPEDWQITPVIVAQDGAALVSGEGTSLIGDQIASMVDELDAHEGSWNWVGVSGGLVDTGIPRILQEWYEDHPWYDTGSLKPWDVTDVADCPDLSGVDDALASKGSAMQAALSGVVSAAKAADDSVRLINVQYPYLTDDTNVAVHDEVDDYVNPCAAGNRPVIESLNDLLTLSGENVYTLDLSSEQGFGDRPTGIRQWSDGQTPEECDCWPGSDPGVQRTASLLQLTRPYGYPYPSVTGSGAVGAAAVEIAQESGVDTTPPVVTGRVADNQFDKHGWYNQPIDIVWEATDENGSGLPTTSIPVTTADEEGNLRRWDSAEVCDTDGNCATGHLDVSIDMTDPTIKVARDRSPNSKGWYKSPVTVSWSFVGDNLSGVDTSTLAAPKTISTNNAGSVTNPTETMCDLAGNCKQLGIAVNLDMTDPVVTGSASASTAARNGWYRTPVTINWTASDQGGSGIDTSTNPAATPFAADGTNVVNSPTVCDNAGRCAYGSVEVSIDQLAPTVDIPNISDGAEFQAGAAPNPACAATDEGGSSLESCILSTTSTTLADNGGYRYTTTATATDGAGNTAIKSITYKVLGFTHVPSAWVTGNASHEDPTYDTVSTSFKLRCSSGTNSLQVTWGRGSKFRLTSLSDVLCYDDPTINPGLPLSPADTFVFTGTGTYNDVAGATIKITIADAGETTYGGTSGVGLDKVKIVITTAGGTVVLDTSATITTGNEQANGEDINDPELAGFGYAIFSASDSLFYVDSGIKVRGSNDGANVYSGYTANGSGWGTRLEIGGNSDVQGSYHAQGGVHVTGSAQIRKDLWAKGNVVIDGGAIVYGNVTTPGSITLSGSGKIIGNAYAGGNISLDGGAKIQGSARAGGTVTKPSWASMGQFVYGTVTQHSAAPATGPTALALPTPPSAFNTAGWPQPYREFATCKAFNDALGDSASGEPNRDHFAGTYRVLQAGCAVAPGGDYRTLTLTGNAAIVTAGCIETKGSAKFVRPAGSTAELWLVSLHNPSNPDTTCSGGSWDNKGIKLAGGSWLAGVPTFVFAKNQAYITGSTTIWGQIYGKTVKVDGGFGQDFKSFSLPGFTGL